MSKQPEALRLADAIADACLMDGISRRQHLDERLLAAAELRRLHSLNAELVEAMSDMLEVLSEAMGTGGWIPSPLHDSYGDAFLQMKEAVAKAKEAQQ